MLIHEKPEPEGAARGDGGRRGMTLIELVIAMALFAIMLCSFMHLQFATLEADRVSSLRLSGTMALRSQLEKSIASANSNMEGKTSIAQGMLSFLVRMSQRNDLGTVENVQLVNNTVVHTFPVRLPGGVIDAGEANLNRTAVGTITVFLREDGVPDDFINWSTIYGGGSSSPNTEGFNMNGNTSTNDDFSNLFTLGESAIAGSDLNFLAIQGQIRYFNSEADMDSGAAAYSVVRNFIISGDSVINN